MRSVQKSFSQLLPKCAFGTVFNSSLVRGVIRLFALIRKAKQAPTYVTGKGLFYYLDVFLSPNLLGEVKAINIQNSTCATLITNDIKGG